MKHFGLRLTNMARKPAALGELHKPATSLQQNSHKKTYLRSKIDFFKGSLPRPVTRWGVDTPLTPHPNRAATALHKDIRTRPALTHGLIYYGPHFGSIVCCFVMLLPAPSTPAIVMNRGDYPDSARNTRSFDLLV